MQRASEILFGIEAVLLENESTLINFVELECVSTRVIL